MNRILKINNPKTYTASKSTLNKVEVKMKDEESGLTSSHDADRRMSRSAETLELKD